MLSTATSGSLSKACFKFWPGLCSFRFGPRPCRSKSRTWIMRGSMGLQACHCRRPDLAWQPAPLGGLDESHRSSVMCATAAATHQPVSEGPLASCRQPSWCRTASFGWLGWAGIFGCAGKVAPRSHLFVLSKKTGRLWSNMSIGAVRWGPAPSCVAGQNGMAATATPPDSVPVA